jgi:hypothetical protein
MSQGGRKTYVKDKALFCLPQHDHAKSVCFPTYSLDVINIIFYQSWIIWDVFMHPVGKYQVEPQQHHAKFSRT